MSRNVSYNGPMGNGGRMTVIHHFLQTMLSIYDCSQCFCTDTVCAKNIL